MAGLPRPAPNKRASMRPPPRPTASTSHSLIGRAQSPAESIPSRRTSVVKGMKSPGVASSAGSKRKEREFEGDAAEETNIHVVVRCRGRSDREVRENSGVVVSTNGVKGKNVELLMGPNALSNKTYHFDKVFSPAADQAMIFDDVVKPVLGEMLSGYNCTIFAYGQTGTGKTYTMSGDMTDTLGILSDAAGIIPRTLYSLFQKLEMEDAECSVKCSFIELYNEELRDLLTADDAVKLKIYEDNSKNKGHTATMVQGMEETHIKSANAGIKLLQQGSYRRQVAATKCNDLSSRSHTVFTITTYMKKTAETGEDFICAGKLNLVDLAGSENIQRSGAENKRAAEAGLINKSLLTLGRVINALVDKGSHIPYRESKLTRLLQDSLGGHTKTCLIATLSPAKSNLEETISTLDYAFRAKNIRNKPQINSMISKKTLLKEFTAEIEKLKSELIATRQRNGVYLSNEQYEEMLGENESRRILSEEQKAKIEAMEASLSKKVNELFSLTSNFNALKKDNEATKFKLDNTEDVLERTEIVLRETKQMLEEETAMRQAHQKTESELHTLGRQLISTVDDSVRDLDGVHSKLRRKSDLHAMNQENWESSTSKVVDLSKMVDSKVESFQMEQSQRLAALSNRVDMFVTSEVQHVESSQQHLQSSLEQFTKTHGEVSEQAVHSRDEMNEVLEEIKVLREDVKTKVGEGLNGLSAAAARISGEVISELEQFHAQLHTSYSSLGKDFKYIFEGFVVELNAQKREADDLRKQLQEANQKALTASRDAAADLQSSLEMERKRVREDRRGLLANIENLLVTQATADEARWSSAIKQTSSILKDSSDSFEKADRQYSAGMDEWAKNEQVLVEHTLESRDSLKAKMKKDWTIINEHNTSIQSSTKAVHEETVRIVDAQLAEMATQMAALDEFVTRAREQNGQQHANRAQGLQRLSSDVHKAHTGMSGRMASTSERVQAYTAASRSDLTAVQSGIQAFNSSIHEPIASLRTELTSTPMLDYTPTGTTPQKRDWNYPTVLPKTIPSPKPVKETKTPKKHISPSKSRPASPIKAAAASPSKTKVFTDIPAAAFRENATIDVSELIRQGGLGGGLKEVSSNVHAGTAVGEEVKPPMMTFSKSVNGAAGSKLPTMKSFAGVKKEKENNGGTGALGGAFGGGRRLRSSPLQ